MKRAWLATVAVGATVLSACTGGGGSSAPRSAVVVPSSSGAAASISGDITYLSHRTDLDQDGTYKRYIAEFNKIYPKVHVTIQSDTNYDNDTLTKLSNGTVPDVLDIPSEVPKADLPRYFVPYGSVSALGQKYNWVAYDSYQGKVYGLATFGNVSGMVVNLQVWAKAGIDLSNKANWPKSPQRVPHRSQDDQGEGTLGHALLHELPRRLAGQLGRRRGVDQLLHRTPTTSLPRRTSRGHRCPAAATSTSSIRCCTAWSTRSWSRRTPRRPTGRTRRPLSPRARSGRCSSAPGRCRSSSSPPRPPERTRPTSASFRSRSRSTGSGARLPAPTPTSASVRRPRMPRPPPPGSTSW